MATADILLLKHVKFLGSEGECVKVKAGFFRNYLFPKKLAVLLSGSNKKQMEALAKARLVREANELDGAKKLAEGLAGLSIAIVVKTGENGKLFGSVSAQDIHSKLVEAGFSIDKKFIQLPHGLKTVGHHVVKIKLHDKVEADLSVDIVSENPING